MGNSSIIMYTTEDGLTKIETTFDEDTVWLSLEQMAELFQRDKSTISRHIKNIFEEGELTQAATVAKFATVQTEGTRTVERNIDYYNLDVIISVGYRVKSHRGTQFRIWAMGILKEYMKKGFAFMCIPDTKPFFLWLADFLFVLVRNVGLLVVDAVADIGFIFQNFLYLTD